MKGGDASESVAVGVDVEGWDDGAGGVGHVCGATVGEFFVGGVGVGDAGGAVATFLMPTN